MTDLGHIFNPKTIKHLIILLFLLFESPYIRASVVIKCDVMWSLMRSVSSGDSTVSLPPRVQRDLVGSLIQCGVGETKRQYLTEVWVSTTS